MPAAPLVIPNPDFVSGTVIESQKVDDNNSAIVTRVNKIRNLNTNTTTVGNVGASGPDVLMTYDVPAGYLSAVADRLKFKASGKGANNANAKSIRYEIGGVTLDTISLGTGTSRTWDVEADIFYLTNTTLRVRFEMRDTSDVGTSPTTNIYRNVDITVASIAANNLNIRMLSTVSTADNDITQTMAITDLWLQ